MRQIFSLPTALSEGCSLAGWVRELEEIGGGWRRLNGVFSMGRIFCLSGIMGQSVMMLQSFCQAVDGNKGLNRGSHVCNL